MRLFSWFIKRNKAVSTDKLVANNSQNQNNNMWPTAQVKTENAQTNIKDVHQQSNDDFISAGVLQEKQV